MPSLKHSARRCFRNCVRMQDLCRSRRAGQAECRRPPRCRRRRSGEPADVGPLGTLIMISIYAVKFSPRDKGLPVPVREAAMIHKFKVGQSVISASALRPRCNTYLVLKQLPLTSFEPQYWIQGVRSGHDCIVCESQIEAAEDHRPRLSYASLGALKARPQSRKSA